MNRDFVFNHQQDRPSTWSRVGSTLNRWLWGALCCGVPGIPCYFCTCCERMDNAAAERNQSRTNRQLADESTATAERMSRPHRPHAPCGRKSTPEMLSAVRCALSQLQGEPAPPLPVTISAVEKKHTPEPG